MKIVVRQKRKLLGEEAFIPVAFFPDGEIRKVVDDVLLANEDLSAEYSKDGKTALLKKDMEIVGTVGVEE